jgi:hypothetical protein
MTIAIAIAAGGFSFVRFAFYDCLGCGPLLRPKPGDCALRAGFRRVFAAMAG